MMINLRQKCLSFFAAFLLLAAFQGSALGAEISKRAAGGNPPQVAPSPVKMIWDYKEKLGLGDTQIASIKESIDTFQKEAIRLRSKLQIVELDIQDLVDKKADLNAIKAKLAERAELQIDFQMMDIQTARTIDGILTPEQIKKWKAIQKTEAARGTGQTSPRRVMNEKQ